MCWINGFLAALIALVAGLSLSGSETAPIASGISAAQERDGEELPTELQYVPPDAAAFLFVDAAAIWDHPILKSIRKADLRLAGEIDRIGKDAFGIAPDDVRSAVLFVPRLKEPVDTNRLGIVVTFKKPFSKERIRKGALQVIPKGEKVLIESVNERTAIVLLNLGEEYAKPAKGRKGPLSDALKAAAGGKHTLVGGVALESLPEEFRGPDAPAPLRPFQPLFKATSVTVTLDLGKSVDLNVRIQAGTAGQAGQCEKALGVLLGLIQDETGKELATAQKSNDVAIRDLAAIMKALVESTRSARFETLGNETRMALSMPANLPYAGAYLAAKKKVQSAAAAQVSANNLKQIAIAVHAYNDQHGNLPPAAICDKAGKPLLSWRVLLLPYLEQNELYKQFKLDEPWDSEHNKKLLAKMPDVYLIPGQGDGAGTDTHYRVFVGNGAGFDWLMGGKLQAIADGTSNTVMCVTAATAVPWTKPEELDFDPDKDMTRLVGAVVEGRIQVAMFDGSVRSLTRIPSKKALHGLITQSGGEVVNIDDR